MKAFVFSIGEPTTDLCVWSLKRQGMEVVLMHDEKTTLWQKLKDLYQTKEEELLRVDADIIVNNNLNAYLKWSKGSPYWWTKPKGWGWYSQNLIPISVTHMKRPALDVCREKIDLGEHELRPETRMWRLPEFHNPRVCEHSDIPVGIHGYGQDEGNIRRVHAMKDLRHQEYDWELFEAIDKL